MVEKITIGIALLSILNALFFVVYSTRKMKEIEAIRNELMSKAGPIASDEGFENPADTPELTGEDFPDEEIK